MRRPNTSSPPATPSRWSMSKLTAIRFFLNSPPNARHMVSPPVGSVQSPPPPSGASIPRSHSPLPPTTLHPPTRSNSRSYSSSTPSRPPFTMPAKALQLALRRQPPPVLRLRLQLQPRLQLIKPHRLQPLQQLSPSARLRSRSSRLSVTLRGSSR